MQSKTTTQSNFAWITEHSMEIAEKYAGKWIAVYGGGIVGVGDTAGEAANQARQVCKDGEFLLEAVEADWDAIYAQL